MGRNLKFIIIIQLKCYFYGLFCHSSTYRYLKKKKKKKRNRLRAYSLTVPPPPQACSHASLASLNLQSNSARGIYQFLEIMKLKLNIFLKFTKTVRSPHLKSRAV